MTGAAIVFSNAAIRLDPKAVKPMFRRGLAYEGTGAMSRALADFKAALMLAPDEKAIFAGCERLSYISRNDGAETEEETVEETMPSPSVVIQSLSERSRECAGFFEGLSASCHHCEFQAKFTALLQEEYVDLFDGFCYTLCRQVPYMEEEEFNRMTEWAWRRETFEGLLDLGCSK